jgi:hypothetical protein
MVLPLQINDDQIVLAYGPDSPIRSRDAVFCIRGLRHGTGKNAERDRVTPNFCSRPGGRTGFGSITLGAFS